MLELQALAPPQKDPNLVRSRRFHPLANNYALNDTARMIFSDRQPDRRPPRPPIEVAGAMAFHVP
jgi:hypothetical protein